MLTAPIVTHQELALVVELLISLERLALHVAPTLSQTVLIAQVNLFAQVVTQDSLLTPTISAALLQTVLHVVMQQRVKLVPPTTSKAQVVCVVQTL